MHKDTPGWYVVTGANSGIGRAIARALAARGLPVVMACRNRERSEGVRDALAAETGNPRILLLPLDLASADSIRGFVQAIGQRGLPIEALVNNAGGMSGSFCTTAEGFEQTVGVNYIGTYLLSRLLAPRMRRGGRIVNTGSLTYRFGRVDERLLQAGRAGYGRLRAYSNSKRALVLFSAELARALRPQGISAYVADPGIVDTRMIAMERWFDPLADVLFRPLIRTPERGAETAVWLATGGAEAAGYPPALYYRSKRPKRLPASATDPARCRRLWEQTETLTLRSDEIEALSRRA